MAEIMAVKKATPHGHSIRLPLTQELVPPLLTEAALGDVHKAKQRWLAGQPRSEEAFMNQLTSVLTRARRGCDIGVHYRVVMKHQLAFLHRRGERQTDLYGADLALTVHISDPRLTKTALFQIKRSDVYKVRIEREQLEHALADARTRERSFALAVDRMREGIRLAKSEDLLGEFGDQRSKEFDASLWHHVTNWLWKWLSCDIGSESNDPTRADSIETLLRSFVVGRWTSPWERAVPAAEVPEYPDDSVPAISWLLLELQPGESLPLTR